MTILPELLLSGGGSPVPHVDPLRLAVAAYLARYKDASRVHTESDLRAYLAW
jgi:integrase/recombinase XerD